LAFFGILDVSLASHATTEIFKHSANFHCTSSVCLWVP